jgi:hypothetical protein
MLPMMLLLTRCIATRQEAADAPIHKLGRMSMPTSRSLS